LTQKSEFENELTSVAEATAVTKPVVVSGLGYPNGREQTSPSPVGWQAQTTETTIIEKQVSRETSR
jgi:hypothetical protein